MSPEVLERQATIYGRGRYDASADMWSVGVITFILLSGRPPFRDDDLDNDIMSANFRFHPSAIWYVDSLFMLMLMLMLMLILIRFIGITLAQKPKISFLN